MTSATYPPEPLCISQEPPRVCDALLGQGLVKIRLEAISLEASRQRRGRQDSFVVHAGLAEHPLESPNPAPEFVLRNHEDMEIGRAPREKATAQLLKGRADCLLVSYRGWMAGPV